MSIPAGWCQRGRGAKHPSGSADQTPARYRCGSVSTLPPPPRPTPGAPDRPRCARLANSLCVARGRREKLRRRQLRRRVQRHACAMIMAFGMSGGYRTNALLRKRCSRDTDRHAMADVERTLFGDGRRSAHSRHVKQRCRRRRPPRFDTRQCARVGQLAEESALGSHAMRRVSTP